MNEKMHRWSAEHPLPVHVTEGTLTAFMLISPNKPPFVREIKGISITSAEYGSKWQLEFRLNNARYSAIFESFYNDIYDSTWETDLNNAASEIIGIFNRWKTAFTAKALSLTEEEIQGIIGELIVVRDVLLHRYSARQILDGWMLEKKGKQDFIFPDRWFEVKTTRIGSNSVKISSVEQLDMETDGILSII